MRAYRLLLDPTTQTEGTTPPATPPAAPPKPDGFEALAAKHSNDGVGLARNLYDQLQAAQSKVAELSGKLPGEGSLVLTAEQAKAWSKYSTIGKPDEVKAWLEEGNAAKGEVAKFAREKVVRTVAEVAGFDADVLATLAGDLEFEVADETVKGKTVKVAKVKDGDQSTPLDKYAEAKWGKFMASLKPSAAPKPLGTPPSRIAATSATYRPNVTPQDDGQPRPRIAPIGGW